MPPTFSGPFPILTVPDLPSTVRFYRRCFGFAPGYRWPAEATLDETEFIVVRLGGHEVGFGRAAASDAGHDWSGIQLSIRVDDIHEAWDWVMRHGATAIEPPVQQPWDEWSAFVADPNGIRVMLYAPVQATRASD
jgi:uncharacterized glyoxalase superfamily protein PhnB